MKNSKSLAFSLFASSFILLPSLFAAPPAKGPVFENVAEGYCAWSGVTEANRISGRRLCPSDLRHKLVAIFYIDAKDYEKQLVTINKAAQGWNPIPGSLGTTYETMELNRNRIAVTVLVGKDIPEEKTIRDYLYKNAQEIFGGNVWYFYKDVKGTKVPDHGGKLPFYCILGPEPGDPLASGVFDAAAEKKVCSLRGNGKYLLQNWKPYYGTVEEPQAVKNFSKMIATSGKGKGLEALTATCYKGITASKDPEKAKECQILYDALEQTRSDYLFDIASFAGSCPTRAFYEAQIVMKQWPKSKKSMKAATDRIKAIPDAPQLCKMFEKIKTWGAEDFKFKKPAEAKAAEAELKKMKVTCDGLIQKSNVNVIQSCAAWIGSEAEALAPQMADKVQGK